MFSSCPNGHDLTRQEFERISSVAHINMMPVGPDEDEIELTYEEIQYIANQRNMPHPLDGETWEPLTEEDLQRIADQRNVDYLRRLGWSLEDIIRLPEEELRRVADQRNIDYLRWLGLT